MQDSQTEMLAADYLLSRILFCFLTIMNIDSKWQYFMIVPSSAVYSYLIRGS
jgi:hypothetical protein